MRLLAEDVDHDYGEEYDSIVVGSSQWGNGAGDCDGDGNGYAAPWGDGEGYGTGSSDGAGGYDGLTDYKCMKP